MIYYFLGTLCALATAILFFVSTKMLFEILVLILDTLRICEFVRENPDEFKMDVHPGKEIPLVIGLRGKDNPEREALLERIKKHNDGVQETSDKLDNEDTDGSKS